MNCPKCGKEMIRVEKSTMSGRDMRTYRCDHCQEEHIVDYGVALWQAMSDAREAAATRPAEEESLQKEAVARQRREGRSPGGGSKFYRVAVIVVVGLVAMVTLLSSLMR